MFMKTTFSFDQQFKRIISYEVMKICSANLKYRLAVQINKNDKIIMKVWTGAGCFPKEPYIIYRGGQVKSLFVLIRVGTISENEYGTFAILWSKSAIFRGAWQNVDMQLHPWAPTTLIPHIRAFKRGI